MYFSYNHLLCAELEFLNAGPVALHPHVIGIALNTLNRQVHLLLILIIRRLSPYHCLTYMGEETGDNSLSQTEPLFSTLNTVSSLHCLQF